MKHPAHWDRSDLHRHLQHALELELWTIPLYLTALYSIKDIIKIKHQDFPDAAKLLFSVVVQEMLHAEIVCNLSNALGYSPRFNHPVYDESKGIPFIHPPPDALPDGLRRYQVKPQALNKESLKLFCVIEMPHARGEIVWEHKNRYSSIAELYEALKIGVVALWDSCFVGESMNRRQKDSFREYHNERGKKHGFSIMINSVETALKAIEAIVEQGEGADAKHVPADFRPHVTGEGEEFDAAMYRGNLSHYQKFRILLHSHHKLPSVHEAKSVDTDTANSNMREAFLKFWNAMEMNFSTEGNEMPKAFWQEMAALGNSLAEVWQAGTSPDFNFDSSRTRGNT
jgi:hypothetical protein